MARKMKQSTTEEDMLLLFKGKTTLHSSRSPQWRQTFCDVTAFDADGSGTISSEELRSVILYLIENADEDEVRGIIKQIDRYDTGEIDYQGAETLLESFFCVFFF